MSGFVRELGALLLGRGEAVERTAAGFRSQREKRAADFAEKSASEKTEPKAPAGVLPARLVDWAGEIAEKLGLAMKAKTRELADRLGQNIGRLFS